MSDKGQTPIQRPRRPKPVAPRPKPNGTNGHAIPHDAPERRLTRAVEELHAAAKAMNLKPMALEWQETPGETSEVDPATEAAKRHLQSLFDDYEGLRAGPIATAVADMPAPPEPHAFLVGNLIRPGTTVMLAGPPGAAKSWASRQLALACGAGIDYFLDRYAVAKPLNVLVVDEDNGPDEEWRRDETLLQHLELDRSQVKTVRRVSLEGVLLEHESWQRWLRGQIRLHELDLVILDPISEMHGGRELREEPGLRAVIAFLKRLKVDFPKMSTLLVHHTRKRDSRASGPPTLDEVRGQWGQTPDVVVLMTPMADRRVRWEVHKRVPHSALILEQVAEGLKGQGGLKLVEDGSVATNIARQNEDRVMACIDAGSTTVEQIVIATKMKPSTVYAVIKRLRQAHILTPRGELERADEGPLAADEGIA